MENPCLTFATPTLLAGDKSLADVIAHEISHSWTGNLVTNATWEHFWLNEGWTVWLERKITSRFKGGDDHRLLSAEMGWKHLKDDVALLSCNCENGDFTKLVWPLGDQDPDDAFSGVPYEKGFCTLNHLENLIGTPKFEAFAKEYVVAFKFKSLTTGDFKDFFEAYCKRELGDAAPVIDWEALFFTSGLPSPAPDFSNALSASARALAATWIGFANAKVVGSCDVDIAPWSSQMKCVFLEAMLDHAEVKGQSFPEDVLKGLDATYSLSESRNAEIRFRWQKLCLASDVAWVVPQVFDFVRSQGRMKFVRPLYRALANSSAADEARKVFMECAMSYHPIARKMLAADLKIDFM